MLTNKLNKRQKEIIKILIKHDDKPITISSIAKKLEFSSRTVLREMENIEKWFYENGFDLIKKPGVGLIVNESIENKKLILELLEVEKIQKSYSKEERKRIMVAELLISKEPLKLFYFASQLKVSEGTLSSDLEEIEKWLKSFDVNLIRKPGLGIYVKGKEHDIRKVLVNLLYDTVGENGLIGVIKDSVSANKNNEKITFSIENRLLKFIDKSIIKNVEDVIDSLEEESDFKLLDSSYVGLVIHLSLAIQRIINNESIVMDKDYLNELSKLPEFKIGKKIVKSLEEKFSIDIPEDEVGYVTMHLKGSKLKMRINNTEFSLQKMDINAVVYHIINTVEKELNTSLSDDRRLVLDLTNHLIPAISRLKMNLNIRNPLLEDIKANYNKIFYICEKCCEILKPITNLEKIPESEIAYITMHIAAALEKSEVYEKVSVVIVCPTGIGTSKLLQSTLEQEFKWLDVRGTTSAINIVVEELVNEQIDLVISTVELNLEYNYIIVSAILTEQDRIVIKDKIKGILKKKKYNNIAQIIESKKTINYNSFNRETIKEISKLGEKIILFIDNIKILQFTNIESLKELISKASLIFATSKEAAIDIEESLIERERISSTYLSEFNIMLLHCKTTAVEHVGFSYIKLQNHFTHKDNNIEGAIVALIPEEADEIQLEVISEINSTLIERKNFITILKEENESEIIHEIEDVLLQFYKKKINNYLK